MKRTLVFGMSAVASGVLCLDLLGSGIASATNEYAGQTYAKASQQIAGSGGKAIIATVVGEQLATSDCMVTGSRKASFLDSSGKSAGSNVLLDLNCNQPLAQPGKSGNSAATPQGAQLKAVQEQADQLENDLNTSLANGTVPYCGQSGDAAQSCKSFCDAHSGTCPDDLLSYLANL